jgi:hypothetical protein
MSTALYMVCEECKERSDIILSHSCFWKKCRPYEENFAVFISKHFDQGCNYSNFRMTQEGDVDEENYTFEGNQEEDK